MIFFFVSLLIFCATVALYFSLLLRKREQSTQRLKERVGVAKPPPGEWTPLAVERDERLSAMGVPPVSRGGEAQNNAGANTSTAGLTGLARVTAAFAAKKK